MTNIRTSRHHEAGEENKGQITKALCHTRRPENYFEARQTIHEKIFCIDRHDQNHIPPGIS